MEREINWRNISRNSVVTRTPTQVASHAQKYFIRQQLFGGKDKRRASIHDIITVNLTENHLTLPEYKNSGSSDQCKFQWNPATAEATVMCFNQTHGDLFMSPRYGGNSIAATVGSAGGGLHEFYKNSNSPDQCKFQWNSATVEATTMRFNQTYGDLFMSPRYGGSSFAATGGGGLHESYGGAHNMVFQMQPRMQYPHR